MREDIPIPGTSKYRLVKAGINQFSQKSYDEVDVDSVAAEAGVTVGSLYHHFQSKKAFYGVLRDDMTQRVLDRMEAVAEILASHQPHHALKGALMAAYDGVLRIEAGKLLTEPDPRGSEDAIGALLGELAAQDGMAAAMTLGILLAAALRAALTQSLAGHADARKALETLLS